ncbi:MAG: hypothetical protein IT210_26630 [Armatimonadetes bacterium]|nr:hypothetical protein [Armatimonadota bacterium]
MQKQVQQKLRQILRQGQAAWRRWRWRQTRARRPGLTRLNLGCGSKPLAGYLNIDLTPGPGTDFVTDIADLSFLETGDYTEIRLDAVFEHLWRWEQAAFLQECHRALTPGGSLVLNWLPDFAMITRLWQNRAPGLIGPAFSLYEVYRFTHGDPDPWNAIPQIHKDLFTQASIVRLLETAGFGPVTARNVCFDREPIPLNLRVVAYKPGASPVRSGASAEAAAVLKKPERRALKIGRFPDRQASDAAVT